MATELIERRTINSKTFHLGGNKAALEAHTGPIHYKDEQGVWQDIDPDCYEADSEGYSAKFTKLPYVVRISDDGGRRIYPDRNDLSYWVQLSKPFLNMGTPQKAGGYWYWDFLDAIIAVRMGRGSVKFAFRLKNADAPSSITIPFSTQGITRQGNELYHDGRLVAILRIPVATDALGAERECEAAFNDGSVTISLDTTGLEYPIEIDPTIDTQVNNRYDDGRRYTGSYGYSSNDVTPYIGWHDSDTKYNMHVWARFTGITIGGEVTTAYLEYYAHEDTQGSPKLKIYGVDEDNPDYPADASEFDADPLTTAVVAWEPSESADTWIQTPSLVPILEELRASYTIDNDAIMFQVKNGDVASGYHRQRIRNWDYSGNTYGPKLHIEYTVAGGVEVAPAPALAVGAVTGPVVAAGEGTQITPTPAVATGLRASPRVIVKGAGAPFEDAKYAVIYDLTFGSQANRDAMADAVDEELAGKSTWGTTGKTKVGDTEHLVEVRFNGEGDMDDFFWFVEGKIRELSATGGSVVKHYCAHACGVMEPCRIIYAYEV